MTLILYLDSSALVKRYVTEAGSEEVGRACNTADILGTALITKAEVSAAFARAARMGILSEEEAIENLALFQIQWQDYFRLPVSEATVNSAAHLAWEYNLRGYDAVHLAAALYWQNAVSEIVTLFTYDRQLWDAGRKIGLMVLPERL
jgi:predicted nucleic acid-binding protein